MTHGSNAKWADTADANWIKAELDRRDWNKTRLTELLAEEAGVTERTAYQAVRRVTVQGRPLSARTEALFSAVLGPRPLRRQETEERLAELVAEGERVVRELPALLAAVKETQGKG